MILTIPLCFILSCIRPPSVDYISTTTPPVMFFFPYAPYFIPYFKKKDMTPPNFLKSCVKKCRLPLPTCLVRSDKMFV